MRGAALGCQCNRSSHKCRQLREISLKQSEWVRCGSRFVQRGLLLRRMELRCAEVYCSSPTCRTFGCVRRMRLCAGLRRPGRTGSLFACRTRYRAPALQKCVPGVAAAFQRRAHARRCPATARATRAAKQASGPSVAAAKLTCESQRNACTMRAVWPRRTPIYSQLTILHTAPDERS